MRTYTCKKCLYFYSSAWEAISCCMIKPFYLVHNIHSSLNIGDIVSFSNIEYNSFDGSQKWVYKNKKNEKYRYFYVVYQVIPRGNEPYERYKIITCAARPGPERFGTILQENLDQIEQLLNPWDTLKKESIDVLEKVRKSLREYY